VKAEMARGHFFADLIATEPTQRGAAAAQGDPGGMIRI